MEVNRQVFLSLKGKVVLQKSEFVLLKDLIDISAEEGIKQKLENLAYPISEEKKSDILIPAISVISFIKKSMPSIDLVVVGEKDVLINFAKKDIKDKYKMAKVILVCFILFIGSITAIVNFHSDVDMKRAHRVIYRVITGIETDNLLLLQIPYSLGIGVGMSVFFNHIFNKKINKEPTPLDMEIYTYQQNINEYIKNNSTRE